MDHEHNYNETNGYSWKCRCGEYKPKKTDWGYILFCIGFSILFIGVVLGFRILWAKFVYHDMRCAFAECRIQVNP